MNPDFTLSTSLDILIAILLVATIAYAVSLNRKLTRLHDDKGEMETLIARLIEASERARAGLEELRAHAVEVGERLQQGLDRANGRVDELAFLIEKAEDLSRRLSGNLAAAPAGQTAGAKAPPPQVPSPQAPPTQAPPPPASPPPASPEEASLLETLRGMR